MGYLHINIWAVLVAALVTFAIGALWYSHLLFAKPWIKAHGYTPEKLKTMQTGAGRAYGVSLLCYLVMAAVLAVLVNLAGLHSLVGGVKLGILCWLGFAATIGLTAHMFSEKTLAAYLIDAGYQLVYLVVMGGLLEAWR